MNERGRDIIGVGPGERWPTMVAIYGYDEE